MADDITVPITGSIDAIISSTDAEASLDAPIIAVNWFNTNSLLLYNIYNFLASRSVRAVGGEVVVKGKVNEVIAGEDTDHRNVVLIVRYPSGPQFAAMMKSTYFKLVSILRQVAVTQFTFGFTQPTSESSSVKDHAKDKAYLIHHFRGADYSAEVAELAKGAGLGVVYSGCAVARLGTRQTGAEVKFVPTILDGVIVLQGDSNDKISSFAASDEFRTLSDQPESSYTATFHRLL